MEQLGYIMPQENAQCRKIFQVIAVSIQHVSTQQSLSPAAGGAAFRAAPGRRGAGKRAA